MSDIVKMISDITKFEDLQQFANAQYTTLLAQSKKIHKLQDDLNKALEELERKKQESLVHNSLDTSQGVTNDAETTCLVQLALLKGKAMLCELTLEETKKVEIYAKVLQLIKTKSSEDSEDKKKVEKIDTKDLLSLVTNIKAVE